MLDADDVPVGLSRYLSTGRKERLRRVRLPMNAEPVDQPLIVGYNSAWENYYHWLTQCLFPAWLWNRSSVHRDALFLTPRLTDSKKVQWQSWPFTRVAAASHYQASVTHVIELTPSVYENRCMERLSAICGVRHEVQSVPATGFKNSLQWHVDTSSFVRTIGHRLGAH